MPKKKLKLNNLSVNSFVTQLDEQAEKVARGGATVSLFPLDTECGTCVTCKGETCYGETCAASCPTCRPWLCTYDDCDTFA